ncbi:tyrosine-type recombinase/integrase [Geojedonia litorea]|uniref:Tyrosine-type recombinase/integrase n=1 Tax=Geojedonia litorea TaxID=1268269 RepID=A0ABV9N1Z0_9FLAO
MKPIITLTPFQHHHRDQIAIGFSFDANIKAYIKGFNGAQWSSTHKTFYVLDSATNLHELFSYLQAGGYYVDYSAMRFKQKSAAPPLTKLKPPDKLVLYKALHKELQQLLKDYVTYLKGKRLSENTISSYAYFVLRYLHFNRAITLHDWTTRHIELFMEGVIAKEHYSVSSHRQCVSALKYLSTLCSIEGFDASTFKRPKKSLYLPTVLSKEAIIEVLQVTKNLKHRALLGLLYSGGLRVGELLQLELKDLDMDRSQIHIKQGKGRKDRVVVMSEVIKPLFLNYIHTYQPTRYFVEGPDGGPYSASSVRQVLKRSCQLAGIKKKVTPHTLRHSYATHMLENGVDLRYIQALLGHAKPETTMIYTHVAQKSIMQIKNPLDVTVEGLLQNDKRDKNMLISRDFKG